MVEWMAERRDVTVKKSCAALLLALCLTLCACAAPGEGAGSVEPPPDIKELTIAVASDLHYLSQALTDNGPLFQEVVRRGDGKLMLYIEEITEAFTEQMIAEKPDLLILSGDLSFNGEYQSHVDLTEKLRRIEEAGVQVLALSGNHDVNLSFTVRYEGEGYERVQNTTAEDFRALYRDFGYAEALSVDDISGSYVYAPCQGLRIIMLDTNSQIGNIFPEKSFSWLEQQLMEAQQDGAQVITASHQNLLIHNSLFISSYRIMNGMELEVLLKKYGVLAHLSGHMHIQHYAEDGIPEVLTSPLSLTPCRYGLLHWDAERLDYEAKSVDVADWAERQGLTDETLLHFADYARESFYQRSYRQIINAYAESGLPEETVERMARCFAEANLGYFTGERGDREALTEELAFWKETVGEGMETAYLRSILLDESPDALSISLRSGAD